MKYLKQEQGTRTQKGHSVQAFSAGTRTTAPPVSLSPWRSLVLTGATAPDRILLTVSTSLQNETQNHGWWRAGEDMVGQRRGANVAVRVDGHSLPGKSSFFVTTHTTAK